MKQVVAIDIGGTHVRFAIATVARRTVVSLGEATTFDTGDFPSLERAWTAFAGTQDEALPNAVAISFAGPVHGDMLKLTNSSWLIRPSNAGATLGVATSTLINDFAAIGHAVAHLGPNHYRHICGPDAPLPELGTISIIGPGTGLGVAHVLRRDGGYDVIETEGGHMDFAALDVTDDRIVAALRAKFGRVSAERVASGPGLRNIQDALAVEGTEPRQHDDDALWEAALDGSDWLAKVALDRFCLSLGSISGDVTLTQGGSGVVIAGGVGLRLADHLAGSGFPLRFVPRGASRPSCPAFP